MSSPRFKPVMLFVYAVGGAIGYCLIVSFSSHPPNPETIGESAYRWAWIQIVVGGSIIGVICYLIGYFRERRISRRSEAK